MERTVFAVRRTLSVFCYFNVRSGCCCFLFLSDCFGFCWCGFCLPLLFEYVLGFVREWQLSLHICAVCFFCFSLPYKTDCRRTKDKITKQNQNHMKESRKRRWWRCGASAADGKTSAMHCTNERSTNKYRHWCTFSSVVVVVFTHFAITKAKMKTMQIQAWICNCVSISWDPFQLKTSVSLDWIVLRHLRYFSLYFL